MVPIPDSSPHRFDAEFVKLLSLLVSYTIHFFQDNVKVNILVNPLPIGSFSAYCGQGASTILFKLQVKQHYSVKHKLLAGSPKWESAMK